MPACAPLAAECSVTTCALAGPTPPRSEQLVLSARDTTLAARVRRLPGVLRVLCRAHPPPPAAPAPTRTGLGSPCLLRKPSQPCALMHFNRRT